ncbi:formate-dependent phosphoribosylglycinamide formyltransferase [Sphingomicrobium aestuariivivum]|uniref:formate-dependent phosphoribosylglycinamide formyltransferase n=1 Tax=Sphingomicrobium aestuariivivum TaxID=1582356 RepID=UPI001FD6DA86|nr:formate-dependent phosphoribosylglycinamide formyltransferase [Sphingomicrobium aestuariivivum]MCJ8190689.1 formate-dependent phosphoribosylglycinamide formyltransferase [Sphingomicrobium aestuariivivum]
MTPTATILLLGAGELGKEFVISCQRLGCRVIACDSYEGAPAMQVADEAEVFDMLDGAKLRAAVEKHRPDHIVPEIEAIRTEMLVELEAEDWHVVPTAKATRLTMNRDAIRDLAAGELGLRTSAYRYAENYAELLEAAEEVGFPLVVKPVMSSSGKGQSTVRSGVELEAAWKYACEGMRGDRQRVIAEGFIDFDYEITLLTVRHAGGVSFCPPIGHRQEGGDYRESWQPMAMSDVAIHKAEHMAAKVVDALGGYGLFGVEFFVKGDEVIFSELSPRPHDTGMVTLVSQNLSEFDLHARAILGLPIPPIHARPSASAVLLAEQAASRFAIEGLEQAMFAPPGAHVDVRIFGKPVTRPGRRMGVALASAPGEGTDRAREIAGDAASKLWIRYDD